jgi:hypothetical protein
MVRALQYQSSASSSRPRSWVVQGRAAEAEAIPLYERALADRERILGPDRRHTLTSRDNLDAAGASQR